MAWNGAGVFNRLFSWTADKAAAINITASRVDSDTNDIVTQGLGNCITRDGQGQPTANLPMATFRHTGVADGVARTDYASLGQSQDGKLNWVAAGGSADALAATYIPALTALVDGQLCHVRAVAANATTTPTFSPNGLTARTITKIGGATLAVADINATGHEIILRYNLANTRWELLNPAAPIVYSNDAAAAVGPTLDIFRDSASPAVSDFIGSVDFNGRDSGAAKQLYAEIITQITDPTAASEDAILILRAVVAGTLTDMLKSSATGITIPGILALPNVTNALALAGSTTGNRSGSPTAGDTRYNTTLNGLEYYNGTAWIVLGQAPTVFTFTSGSAATYTPTAGMVRIRVRMSGGGAGAGAAVTNSGTAGNESIFENWHAAGGSAGLAGAAGTGKLGGAGGTGGADGTGTKIARLNGGAGDSTTGIANFSSGHGGGNPFGGGAAAQGAGAAGLNAATNTGGGGSGGSNGASGIGSSGGAGEYVEFWMTAAQVGASKTYTVGAAANGGAAGTFAGGNGAAGIIIIEEFYS